MEAPAPRRSARTPTCTVPGLLVGLTKLCKLTKVCAAPTLGDEARSRLGTHCGGGYDQKLLLIRLFEAMASLKSAYVKLQRAHFPYDPAKIAFADEIITSELDSVTALQRLCGSSSGIGSLVNERWSVVQELESGARKRDSDIALLKRELEALQRENSRLNKQIKGAEKPSSVKHRDKGFVVVQKELATATPSELLEMFKVASASVQDFAEMVASSMPVSSDNFARDADAGGQSWRGYALEARLSRTMLGATTAGDEEREREEAGLKISAARFDRIMRFCDPMEALMQYPGSSFSRFCRSRYLAAVPPETEAAVFRNLDQRAFVSRGGHPRTWFYRAFATMARSAWALRVLMARCVEHGTGGVRMFYARRGSEYAEEWMQSVAAPASGGREGGMEEKLSVAFTVTPGVKVGDTVVKCRVLLCRHQERFTQVH